MGPIPGAKALLWEIDEYQARVTCHAGFARLDGASKRPEISVFAVGTAAKKHVRAGPGRALLAVNWQLAATDLASIRVVGCMSLAKAAADFTVHYRVTHGDGGLFGEAAASARVLTPSKSSNTRRCQTDAFNASVGFSHWNDPAKVARATADGARHC